MAGIGFELKKLFNRRTLTGQVIAYGYSAMITVGPFVLLTTMALLIQALFTQYGTGSEALQLYTASMMYPVIFSQILTYGFAAVVTRYLADCLYLREYENISASCYGAMLIAQLAGAVVALLFLWDKPLPVPLKIATYVFFLEMIALWLQGVYLTALKDYKSICSGYGIGTTLGILLAWVNCHFGLLEPVLGAMLSVCAGIGLSLCSFMVQIVKHFGYSAAGLNFDFLPYFDRHSKLFFIAQFYSVALYTANFFVWAGEWGVVVADTYLYAPRYDMLAFYAFLSIMPAMMMFVISMELKFYEQYAVYFTYITQKGNFRDIDDARKSLLYTLWAEFKNIMEFQFVFSLMFLAVGSYWFSLIGMPYQDVGIYRLLVLGAFFTTGLQVAHVLLLYLEDQQGALVVGIVFLAANVLFGAVGYFLGEISYGFTFFLAALLAAGAAVMRLQYFCNRVNYYVFCGRPVFAEEPCGLLSRLAKFLYRKR